MKGTAPRGRTTAEDREQSRLLRSSSKEQAENLMIVDLLRNDLGRVAEVGSVVGGRALRPRALPDRLADDLAGERAGARRAPGCWTCSARSSRADRSPAHPSAAPCS